jgi:hypothetical protein
MFRFSIRDVLWLTALAAVLVAWWIQYRSDTEARQRDAQAILALKQQLATRTMVRVVPIPTPIRTGLRPVPGNRDYQMPPERPIRVDPWP